MSAQQPVLKLKHPAGWFAADASFRRALTALSDGAFRLFALICLEADRQTGRFEATYTELAAALGKSKRVIGCYITELETAAICQIRPARNQHARTTFEVHDEFWPYHRVCAPPPADTELEHYIEAIRECCLSLGDLHVGFHPADTAVAKDFYERRIPLGVVRDAMLLGACRKYESWLNGNPPQPIGTLRYFEQIIAEVRNQPLPPGYSRYLCRTLDRYAAAWTASNDASGRARRDPFVPMQQTTEVRP